MTLTLEGDTLTYGLVYHGSYNKLEYPIIPLDAPTREYSWGFYCSFNEQDAAKYPISSKKTILNSYRLEVVDDLRKKYFNEMNMDWMEFVWHCTVGGYHDYDIIVGPVPSRRILSEYEEMCTDKRTNLKVLLEILKEDYEKQQEFQISFHSIRAIKRLEWYDSYKIEREVGLR
jgi:hypothetical protein